MVDGKPFPVAPPWRKGGHSVRKGLEIVDIWERNKELIRKHTDIGEHFTREVIQSIIFIFFTTRRKSASD